MFNIKYLLTPWPVQGDSLERMDPVAGVFMYRNPLVMPRAFVVGKYRIVPSPDGAKVVLLSDEFDPRNEVILYKQPQHSASDGMASTVAIEQYRTNEVALRVKTNKDGLLVLSDTYYPGWKSFVDGVEKEVLQANICQRSVEVPSGEHEVRFVFDSFPVKAGFGITIVSLLVAGGILVASRRKG
jgi:hypothetical protein